MKRFKKILGMFLALAMVAGMVGVMPVMEAKAAKVTMSFDATNHQLTVTTTTGGYVYIGESKNLDTKLKAYTVFEAASTGTSTVINLSPYAKKDVVFWVNTTGDTDDDVKYEIKKSDKKLKVTLALDEKNIQDRFVITNNGDKITIPATTELATNPIQFRFDGEPAWQEACGTTLKTAVEKIEQYGATIYFRHKGISTTSSTTDNKTGTSALMFASAEAKVKYPKLRKVPSITVDYVKGMVKFPKGIEVKGIKDKLEANTSNAATWLSFEATSSKAGSYLISEIHKDTSSGEKFTFYARVPAKGKKPNSSIASIPIISAAPTPALKDTGTTDVVVSLATKSAADATYKGISVKNNTEGIIEYALVTKGGDHDEKTRWTKIASKAEKVLPVTAGNQDLLIRVAGAKEVTKKGSESDPIRMSAVVRQPLEFEIQSTALTLDSSTSAITSATYDNKDKAKNALSSVKTATAKVKIKSGGAITTLTEQSIILPITWNSGDVAGLTNQIKFTGTLSKPLPAGFSFANGAETNAKKEATLNLKVPITN